jgi:hypothetical protein
MVSPRIRIILGACALLAASAVVNASTAWASARATEELEDGVVSTSCGAGTINQCAMKPIVRCEYDFSFNANIFSRSFGLHVKETNCAVIGEMPIYKDRADTGGGGMCQMGWCYPSDGE